MSEAIAGRWRAVRAERRAALIAFFTAGYPTAAAFVDTLRRAAAAGADIIEVGVPFSDPLADGPTIQRSTQAALDAGVTPARAFDLIVEAALPVPVVIMTYLNPVLAFPGGVAGFVAAAARAGAAGLLLTDLPAGTDPGVEAAVAASPLARIPLVAPTTSDARLAAAVRGAGGFVYLISRRGVPGARAAGPPDWEIHVRRVRAATDLPVAVGFGIGSPAQARAAARIADGVVVGSALVEALGTGGPAAVEERVRALAEAVRTVERAA